MKPKRECGLVDILDRLLDKGVILNAELVVTVAGVPLLGLSLSAALASIETMLDYGMLDGWDRDTREWYKREVVEKSLPLEEGEVVLQKSFGSIWHSEGIISSWRSGFWYLTNERLFLWRRIPEGTLFEAPLEEIDAIQVRTEIEFGKEREEIDLDFHDRCVRIHVSNVESFKGEIRKAIRAKANLGEGTIAQSRDLS